MPMTAQNNKASKFWNVANISGNSAELTLYGDICSEAPRDWWTGEKIDGLYITPEGFLEDLETIKNAAQITVKLNSCGGDLYTGIAIHNALKALKGEKTVIVEGIAASAASIVMCAGDKVQVYPGSLVMIHGVSSLFWDYMNLEDLKKSVKAFEASENAIAEIYAVKTGMATDKLRNLMTKETWMTGQQAVDYGFADEVIGGVEPEFNYMSGNILMVNGIKHNLSGFHIPPQLINSTKVGEKGGDVPMNEFQKFLLSLQNSISGFMNKSEGDDGENNGNPEEGAGEDAGAGAEEDAQQKEVQENAIQQRIEAAVKAERNRLQEIDGLPAGIPAELVNAAKYGDKPCDAKELALQALQKQAEMNAKQLQNLKNDTDASGAQDVQGEQAPADQSEDVKKVNEAKAFVAQRKARRQGK